MKQKKEFLINTLFAATIAAIAFLFMKYLLPHLWPFIIAFAVATLVLKLLNSFHSKFLERHRMIAIAGLIIFYVIFFTLLVTLAASIISYLGVLAGKLPKLYKDYIYPFISDPLKNINVSKELQAYADSIVKALPEQISSIVGKVSSSIIDFAAIAIKAAPNALVYITVTMVSSFFIAIDYQKITQAIEENIPKKFRGYLALVKQFLVEKLWVIIKSYAKIMAITFIELAFGLMFLNIDNFIGWALLISLLDILPILGVGTALIPWTVISLISGNYGFAIKIFAIYIVITVIRNIIEPKMVGGSLGLHPIISLSSMYVGLKLFGGAGLFGFPILLSFIMFIRESKGAA